MDENLFKFPSDLAGVVSNRWNKLVGGDYSRPPCPPLDLLRQLFEVSYLAANCPEEMRFPQFNIIATSKASNSKPQFFNSVKFDEPRPFTVQEIRRLAPTVDIAKSSIWVAWDEGGWTVEGVTDLGTSWHRAKSGLGYRYQAPADLLVQVDRPGRVKVHQGAYHIGTLEDGAIIGVDKFDFSLFFHRIAGEGIVGLRQLIEYPEYEAPSEFVGFELIALVNTYIALAAEISSKKHGGMIAIVSEFDDLVEEHFQIKYSCDSTILRDAFVEFMNARHVQGDFTALCDDGHDVPDSELWKAEVNSRDSYDALVEATQFVAGLSGCDGAIVLKNDLTLVGFGAEVLSDFDHSVEIVEGKAEILDDYRDCDIRQFGMRHRSAAKLASRTTNTQIIAVSQDGPISGIYKKDNRVFVENGISVVNQNLPWA
ncbi:putative sensor domain DACNV-containing protein [Ruegeria arenilitoris]|uniref:putative sensor domain DACNV-containing protein n=1 Tax=Ruegeria arenilitoris TaxID=1173585 RepID=UPI00147C00C4|nr:diadenylate cyclase [Ruegeria arenilitoris]